MRVPKQFLLLSLFTVAFVCAKANNDNSKEEKKGEPSINGSVSDADSKKPVPGVTVSITGKGLDKKETLTTDASGNFRANSLVPGEVTIILEKKGYRTYRKEGVMIKEGSTLKLTMDIEEDDDDDGGVFHPLLRMIDGD